MMVRSVIKPSAYFDSVTLMLVQKEVRQLPGVEEAGAVMGTGANKELLRDADLLTAEAEAARPDDLILVVRGASAESADAALATAQELLVRRRESTSGEAYRPKTLATAVRMQSGTNLALISVPGRFAAGVGRDALLAGLHVMLFSDNVPLEAEVELKRLALSRGLLLMGPDCGTAILSGAALGFSNRVRSGSIGIVGAAGTGIQEVTSLIHRGGAGISHAIGTGGRDLTQTVGGMTALHGLAALAADTVTHVIVLISKPPSADVAARLLVAARATRKPVVVCFVGATVAAGDGLHAAHTLEEAASIAVRLATGEAPRWPEVYALPAQEAGRLAPSQKFIRGLYSGGTLCYEALVLLERYVGPVYSNTPLDRAYALESAHRSAAHTVIDMGSDEFTVGRLHPMLDPVLRQQRLLKEADNPEVAVILLDVVLGHGAHPDPASELAPIVRRAKDTARAQGRWLSVVASVCGTEDDPQGYEAQASALIDAGVVVQPSNARAVRLAGLIAEAAGNKGKPREPNVIQTAPGTVSLPDAAAISTLLTSPPHVVNVGLELFAESLASQGVSVISVDWQPPAGGKQKFIEMLDKLNA
ncbi:MAG: acyl-CoA synthetase FdrA [Armatimonadetes bacterium]|nr:acyl-CoA synthetase FdrA [Armatimonadota bacterium]